MSDQVPELDLQHVQNWQSEQLRNASAIISDAQPNLSFSAISPTSTSANGYRSHRSDDNLQTAIQRRNLLFCAQGETPASIARPQQPRKKLQTKNPNPHLISARTYWVQCHRYTNPTNCLAATKSRPAAAATETPHGKRYM
jgi:hypothetical protein